MKMSFKNLICICFVLLSFQAICLVSNASNDVEANGKKIHVNADKNTIMTAPGQINVTADVNKRHLSYKSTTMASNGNIVGEHERATVRFDNEENSSLKQLDVFKSPASLTGDPEGKTTYTIAAFDDKGKFQGTEEIKLTEDEAKKIGPMDVLWFLLASTSIVSVGFSWIKSEENKNLVKDFIKKGERLKDTPITID